MFANMSNGNTNGAGDDQVAPPKKKAATIEQTYQKKSQLEHILLRPDTYIGSVETVHFQSDWFNSCIEYLCGFRLPSTCGPMILKEK